MKMKIKLLGISAGRKEGNTDYLVKEALKAGQAMNGFDFEITCLTLSNKKIRGCVACHKCFGFEKGWGIRDRMCYAHEDDFESIVESIVTADGIIIGSPVYVFGVPSKLRAMMERTGGFTANSMNEAAGKLRYKSFGAIGVAAGRRAGQDQTAAELFNWAFCMGMTIVPAFPTENGLPAASIHFGSADCVESNWFLGKEAVRKENAVMSYPLGAISGLKSVQNIGRSVASHAAVFKYGMDVLSKGEFVVPDIARFRRFPGSLKEGSYIEHLVKKGLVKNMEGN